MYTFFAVTFLLPLSLAAAAALLFLKSVKWKGLGAIALGLLLVSASACWISSCASTSDVEVWNGVVTGKQRNVVSCSHSYQCNCRQSCSGSGKNQSCSTVCDTCYEHSFDVDWDVYTSNRETVSIERRDSQGLIQPERWTRAQLGEPTAIEHSYVNYVKAAPDTLFRHQGLKQKYAAVLPSYPGPVYDYYRVDRLVTAAGAYVADTHAWNEDLAKLNAELGAAKQANVIVVLVRDQPADFFYALEEAWVGGKKNDVVLVVSTDSQLRPQWAQVMAWTTSELFKVKLRDHVVEAPLVDRAMIIGALKTDVSQHFKRKPMKDFAYLRSSISPGTVAWVVTLLLGLAFVGAALWALESGDPFGECDGVEGEFSVGRMRRRRSGPLR